jgi:hypothetical protein
MLFIMYMVSMMLYVYFITYQINDKINAYILDMMEFIYDGEYHHSLFSMQRLDIMCMISSIMCINYMIVLNDILRCF